MLKWGEHMSKTIKINGVDFTNMFTPYGYSVSYKKVDGGLGGIMQDATYTEDEMDIKAVINLPCMPLNDRDLASLLTAVYGDKYVQLYYYDPMAGRYKTIEARRSETSQKYRGTGSDNKNYWTGTVLTLTER